MVCLPLLIAMTRMPAMRSGISSRERHGHAALMMKGMMALGLICLTLRMRCLNKRLTCGFRHSCWRADDGIPLAPFTKGGWGWKDGTRESVGQFRYSCFNYVEIDDATIDNTMHLCYCANKPSKALNCQKYTQNQGCEVHVFYTKSRAKTE